MSGHSKWSSIKHKKGALDAKRGKLFTTIIKELTIAARIGGGNASGNPRLRTAVAAAKSASMPKETIERAIKRGTGEIEGAEIVELTYEGYGPGGVAIFVEASSDNRNRTAGEVRSLFSKNGGNLGEPGSVAWMFTKRGVIQVEAAGADEDALMETALEAGATDVVNEGETIVVSTEQDGLETVREALAGKGFSIQSAQVEYVPNNTVKVEGKEAATLMKLLSVLEDHDDVDRVSANFEMSEELLEQLAG